MPPKRTQPPRHARPSSPPPDPHSDAEILSAFALFAKPRSTFALEDDDGDDDEDAETSVISTPDAHRALRALGLPCPPPDFFDEGQVFLVQEHFVLLAQTMRDSGGSEGGGSDDDGEEEEEEEAAPPPRPKKKKQKQRQPRAAAPTPRQKEDIDHAFALFTHTGPTDAHALSRKITLGDLQRVARELREEIDDSVLKRMLVLANGEDAQHGGWEKGVARDEFEGVMRRAGAWGRGG